MTTRRSLVTIAGVLALVVALGGCDWAQIGFGPDRRSHNPYEPALTPATIDDLGIAWSQPCSCTGVLVAEGTTYAVQGSSLRAFNAATGAPRWSTVVGSDIQLVAVANGLVYLARRPATGTHQLLARDAATGASRFAFTPRAVNGLPVTIREVIVDGPLAFLSGFVGPTTTVYAVNTAGGLVWADQPGGGGATLVADPGKTVYVATSILLSEGGGTDLPLLTGYRESDGARVSSAVVRVAMGDAPVVAFANGLVYTFSAFGHGARGVGLSAVDPATGQVRWGYPFEPVAVTPGAIVGFSEVGWFAFHPVTGAPLWNRFEPLSSEADAAVGELLVRASGGALVAHRLSDGTVVDTFTPVANEGITGQAIAGGQIFVTTQTRLVAVKPV